MSKQHMVDWNGMKFNWWYFSISSMWYAGKDRELYGNCGWKKMRMWGQDGRQQRIWTQTRRILSSGGTPNNTAVPHIHFLWHQMLPTHRFRDRVYVTSTWGVHSDASVLVRASNFAHRRYKSGNTFQDMVKILDSERRKHSWDFFQYILGSSQAADFFNVMSNPIKKDHRLPHAFLHVLVHTPAMHKYPKYLEYFGICFSLWNLWFQTL